MISRLPLPSFLDRFLHAFARNERGGVAVFIALALIPMMVAAGMAIDLSRAYLVKARLSHALDAAGLAVGSMRTATTNSAYLEQKFLEFVDLNYAATDLGATHDLTFTDVGGVITVTGKATLDTVFMRIVGIDTMTVGADAEIVVETSGLELVMVLDNTGSMKSNGKLGDMKTASLELIDILFGDQTAPELLKVGLVPFDQTVNIGSANEKFVPNAKGKAWGLSKWGGCVMARKYPHDARDSNPAAGGSWEPFYNPNSSWDHNKYCPNPITPLTNDRATLEDEINAMEALGSTHINLGAVWGWRTISPGEPFAEGAAYNDPDWNKAVILLTDGENTMIDSFYSAYGKLNEAKLGTTNGQSAASEMDKRLLEVCTGMKNDGIIVYTITFQVPDITTRKIFETCATDTGKYYDSPDAATLNVAFRAIGAELKNLHLSR